MPKKKKVVAKKVVTKKIVAKAAKKVIPKTSKTKPVLNKQVAKRTTPRAQKNVQKISKPKIERIEISKHDEIVHAAETYAVSIDEIISSGNREYEMMITNGRGQELTLPKIEPKKIEGLDTTRNASTRPDEINVKVNPENVLTEEDKKALAMVRARLEASTVMIRSVSPLQTPFAHSSRNFVKDVPAKSVSRAPLVFLSSATIVFAAFVVAVVVTKTGSFSPTQILTPQVQKVAGAETGPQQYTKTNEYTFSYPGNWYASEVKGEVRISDSQKQNAQTVVLVASTLNGKSFEDWFSAQTKFAAVTATPSDSTNDGTNPKVYKTVNTDGGTNIAYFVVGKDKVVTVQASAEQVAERVLEGVVNSFSFL